MEDKRRKLGELLLELQLIDAFQLRAALADQKKWQRLLGESLIELGFISENNLMKSLSKYYQVPGIQASSVEVDPAVLKRVPVQVAEKHRVMPLAIKVIQQKKRLVVAMLDPGDLAALDELQFVSGMKVVPMVGTVSGIHKAIRKHYHNESTLEAFGEERSGITMVKSKPGDNRIHIIRDGREEEVRFDENSQAAAGALAETLQRTGHISDNETRQVLGHHEPVALLARLLFDKGMLQREDLLAILNLLPEKRDN